MVIMTSLFSKSAVFKMLTVNTKRECGVLKFFEFEERFSKSPVFCRLGKPLEIKLRFQISPA